MTSEKYLVDTNLFLEILLQQESKEKAKEFLLSREGQLSISDFSLHSIGVFLFSEKRENLFKEFITDVLPTLEVLKLPEPAYNKVLNIHFQYNLDFDDSYQTAVANEFGLHIVTFDNDFRKVKHLIKIESL